MELCDHMGLFGRKPTETEDEEEQEDQIRPRDDFRSRGHRSGFDRKVDERGPAGRRGGRGGSPAPFDRDGPDDDRRPSRSERRRESRRKSEEEMEDGDEDEEEKVNWKASAIGLLRDITIALIIMLIIIGSMWGYTRNWPPMVVVESPSMQHSDDSEIGVIDTGDLVLVKKIDERSDIVTFFQGKKQDHKTYEEYGDVIIYKKNGKEPEEETPIIHRAILWLEYDKALSDADPADRGHFNIPELGLDDQVGTIIVDENFPSYNISEDRYGPLELRLQDIYRLMKHDPHSGFITKGDNNPRGGLDQYTTSTPVKPEWVIGKARGELPWFGLIKLYVSKSMKGSPPPTSVNMLILTISLLIVIPIIIDIAYSLYIKRKKAEMEKEDDLGVKEEKRGGPPGRGGRKRGFDDKRLDDEEKEEKPRRGRWR